MSGEGWVKLYRKISESFVWTDANQLKLWLLILMKVNHESKRLLFNGQQIDLSSGQMVTGRDALAFEFNSGVSRDQRIVARTLWRWVKRFEKEQMLSIKSTTKYSVITVINWGEYQSNDQQVSNARPTSVQRLSTNKNDKNDKNDKNKDIKNTSKNSKARNYSDDDPNLKLAKILFKKIEENQKIKPPDLNKWANTIRLMIEADKRTGKEVQDIIIWSTEHDFWSGVILSPSSLRKNFDKMNSQKSRDEKSSGAKKRIEPGQVEGVNW